MANEEKQAPRAKCDFPVPGPIPVKSGETRPTVPCGSEERLFSVSRPAKDMWGNVQPGHVVKQNICGKHLGDAWHGDATEAVPLDVAGKV